MGWRNDVKTDQPHIAVGMWWTFRCTLAGHAEVPAVTYRSGLEYWCHPCGILDRSTATGFFLLECWVAEIPSVTVSIRQQFVRLSASLGRSAPYFRQAAARRRIVEIAVLHDPS